MCGLLYSALLEANHEDLSKWIDVVTLGGELKIPMQEVEARLYGYLHAGNEIVVAEEDGVLIGFLIVQPIFIGTIAIRLMYLEPDLRGKNLAYDLVNSLKPKYVLFQTRRDIAPEQCLDVTADKRRCVMMDEKMITWQMKWGE